MAVTIEAFRAFRPSLPAWLIIAAFLGLVSLAEVVGATRLHIECRDHEQYMRDSGGNLLWDSGGNLQTTSGRKSECKLIAGRA